MSDINNKTEENIAFLYSDPRFDGEFRCDLHPKLDKATKTICVDSTFKNKKRSVILIKNLWFVSSMISPINLVVKKYEQIRSVIFIIFKCIIKKYQIERNQLIRI